MRKVERTKLITLHSNIFASEQEVAKQTRLLQQRQEEFHKFSRELFEPHYIFYRDNLKRLGQHYWLYQPTAVNNPFQWVSLFESSNYRVVAEVFNNPLSANAGHLISDKGNEVAIPKEHIVGSDRDHMRLIRRLIIENELMKHQTVLEELQEERKRKLEELEAEMAEIITHEDSIDDLNRKLKKFHKESK